MLMVPDTEWEPARRTTQRHPQLVRGVEAAGADGAVTDTCPSWPTLLAWLEKDLPDEEAQLLNTHVADCSFLRFLPQNRYRRRRTLRICELSEFPFVGRTCDSHGGCEPWSDSRTGGLACTQATQTARCASPADVRVCQGECNERRGGST